MPRKTPEELKVNAQRPKSNRPEVDMTNPTRIRDRVRRDTATIEDYRALANLKKPLDQWDLEELARGRPRDKNGLFTGSKSTQNIPAVIEECRKRFLVMSRVELAVMIKPAFDVMMVLLNDDRVDDSGRPITSSATKFQVAKYIIDQILGMPKARVEVEGENPVAKFLAGAVVLPGGGSPHPAMIEGSIVRGEDDDDD